MLLQANCSKYVLCDHDRKVRDEEAVIRTVVLTACHVDLGLTWPSDQRQTLQLRCSVQMQHVYHECAASIHLDQCDGLVSASDQTTVVRDSRRRMLAG
jgi:hypothetical protein